MQKYDAIVEFDGYCGFEPAKSSVNLHKFIAEIALPPLGKVKFC